MLDKHTTITVEGFSDEQISKALNTFLEKLPKQKEYELDEDISDKKKILSFIRSNSRERIENLFKQAKADFKNDELYLLKNLFLNYWTSLRGINIQEKVNFQFNPLAFNKILKDDMANYKLKKYVVSSKQDIKLKNKHVGVLNIYDFHIDSIVKLSNGNYGAKIDKLLQIFYNKFSEAVSLLKSRGVKEFVFPVGNDFFHSNGLDIYTKNNTLLEVDPNYRVNFQKCVELFFSCRDLAVKNFDKVTFPFIPGNHDRDKIHYLSVIFHLLQKEKKYDNFNILIDHIDENYESLIFGKTVLFFHHGDTFKLTSNLNKTYKVIDSKIKELYNGTEINGVYCFSGHKHTLLMQDDGYSNMKFIQIPKSNPLHNKYDERNGFNTKAEGRIMCYIFDDEGRQKTEETIFISNEEVN